MHTTRAAYERQDFARPDETREFPNVEPVAGTEWCEAPHFQYHPSGTLRIRTDDGQEFDALPGQVTALPSGHDAWVVGDEPVVVVDWWGASTYAKGGGDDPRSHP